MLLKREKLLRRSRTLRQHGPSHFQPSEKGRQTARPIQMLTYMERQVAVASLIHNIPTTWAADVIIRQDMFHIEVDEYM